MVYATFCLDPAQFTIVRQKSALICYIFTNLAKSPLHLAFGHHFLADDIRLRYSTLLLHEQSSIFLHNPPKNYDIVFRTVSDQVEVSLVEMLLLIRIRVTIKVPLDFGASWVDSARLFPGDSSGSKKSNRTLKNHGEL